MNKDKIYFAMFDMIMHMSSSQYFKIYERYGSFEKAYNNISFDMFDWCGIRKEYDLCVERKENIDFDNIKSYLKKNEIQILFYDELPLILQNISDYPFALYCIGDTKLLHYSCISVVGTRKISLEAKYTVELFIPELVKHNFVVVSGMASGVDTLAHQTTIEHRGHTIAVLGTGVDVCYPSENRSLYNKIKKEHLVVSEYFLGAQGDRFHFPVRNRVVAGLSVSTIVIEAKARSGSLITAQLAFDYNRDVFAVPGNVLNENAKGTNWLIKKQIARLIDTPQDILDHLNISSNTIQTDIYDLMDMTQEDMIVFKSLEIAKDIDTLSEELNISVDRLLHILSVLEMKNQIKRIGERWIR